MKTLISIRTIALSLFALAAFVFASNSYAFTFQKIEIKNSDGKVTVVAVDENGNFVSPPLEAGAYTYSWSLVSAPMGSNAQLFGVGRGISSPTGGSADREASTPSVSEIVVTKSTDRESSAPSISEVCITYEISAPRDQSTGMASGKRMHKPFIITKELDRSTPLLSTKVGVFTVQNNGEVCTGNLTFKSSSGAAVKASWNLKENVK